MAETTVDPVVETPHTPTKKELEAENARLQQEVAALRASLAESASEDKEEDRTHWPKRWYRVRLPGVRPRVMDELGRVRYQDYLDVQAVSPGDAYDEYKRYNGITSSERREEISLCPVDEDGKPIPEGAEG